jgi:hypothetical protein
MGYATKLLSYLVSKKMKNTKKGSQFLRCEEVKCEGIEQGSVRTNGR